MISDETWRRLTELTPARIALGRTGSGLPTHEAMKFALAHAQARDAVHTPLAPAEITAGLEALGLPHLTVSSRAVSRHSYLLRPDLGILVMSAMGSSPSRHSDDNGRVALCQGDD